MRPAHDFYPANQANRRNAARSTGPTTAAGKHRWQRNAVRHGLCATFALPLSVNSRFRLASLLWRLPRATTIETDVLRVQAEVLRDRRNTPPAGLVARDAFADSRAYDSSLHRYGRGEASQLLGAGWPPTLALAYPAGRPNPSALVLSDAELPSAGQSRQRSVWPGRYESALAHEVVQTFFCCNQCESLNSDE
jgi:hypothetical protein